MAEHGCYDECSYDRNCIERADWYAAYNLRKDFWGESNEDPFMPKKRLQKIVHIFRICETVKVRLLNPTHNYCIWT
jgi:hypothetical protein